MINETFNFCGMRLFEEPLPSQKIKLSDSVTVSDNFRREFDSWLMGMFGRREPMLKDRFLVSREFGMVIAPPGMAALINTGA